MTVNRYDTSQRATWRRDARGFLRASAAPTRVGILVYRQADGTEIREYRSAEEVGAADSLATLEGAPVTHLHPSEAVTPANAKDLGVGHVGDRVTLDGDLVSASVVIEDAAIIESVDAGDLSELSCGYRCEIDPTPGVFRGERYDQVQRSIRYNHVALGPSGWGRAGPEVSLRQDSGDAISVSHVATPEPTPPNGDIMIKIRLDGRSVEVSEEAAPVIEAVIKERGDAKDKAVAEARAEVQADADAKIQEACARADRAEAERDDAKDKLEKATGAEARAEQVQARLGLERSAAKVLGEDAKLDSLGDDEIRSKVLAKARPSLKLDGKSADYVQALYDAAVEDAKARQDGGLDKLKTVLEAPAVRDDSADEDPRAGRFNAYANFRKGGK